MPPIINCANFPNCPNYVSKLGEVCEACKERERKAEKRRWMAEGFPKWYDNKGKNFKGKEGE